MIKNIQKILFFYWVNFLIHPNRLIQIAGKIYPSLLVLSVISLGMGTWGGLFKTPPDYQQGEVFRLIYIHVPAAILSLGIYAMMGFFAGLYLIFRLKVADWILQVSAPIGAGMTSIALLTGAIWGKPMWGTFWVWDARLTSELILLFIYLGLIVIRRSLANTQRNLAAMSCAIVTLVGLVDLPIIHFSVNWWYTLHQGATILKWRGSSMPWEMSWPLILMILGLWGYYFALVGQRLQQFKKINDQSDDE